MKKLLPLLLAALCVLAPVRAVAKTPRADLVTNIESCEAVLQEFQRDPRYAIPAGVLARAKGLIITNQFKAGLIFGVKAGYGVIMVKQASGRWSLPVLINAGETSIGFQIGANALETIYVITDDQTPRLLFKGRFRLGVDAKAVIGPKAAEAHNPDYKVIDAPLLAYTKSTGVFAGATIKAGFVTRDDESNHTLYNTNYSAPELLYSDWVKPTAEVQPLMNLVQKLAP
ncbi:MAG: lipid-binding SYLF domain-containing protein [Undibacterium sp.]|nr:lipid-binding SYLF domain-containing protein [Opitutaceae bacterium]